MKRNTIQRIKIAEYLKKTKTHPSAEDVYNHVKKEMQTITLATVYRNLNDMASSNEIIKLEINNESHFDGDTRSHQHYVCRNCRKIFDNFQEDINRYAMRKLRPNGFRVDGVNIIYTGLCKKCRGEIKNGKTKRKI